MTEQALVAVCICFYDDASSLERCLDSVVLNMPMRFTKVLALDGVYKGYPNREPLSTDGSKELVLEYQNKYGQDKIQLFYKPHLHERFKRQAYVDIAASQKIPFIIILDSDEWLESKSTADLLDEIRGIDKAWHEREEYGKNSNISGVDRVPKISNVHMIRSVDMSNDGYIINVAERPRLWYRPEDMHYTTKHYYWISKSVPAANEGDTRMLAQTALGLKSYVIHNLQMFHSHDRRTEERERKRIIYEREKLPRLEK